MIFNWRCLRRLLWQSPSSKPNACSRSRSHTPPKKKRECGTFCRVDQADHSCAHNLIVHLRYAYTYRWLPANAVVTVLVKVGLRWLTVIVTDDIVTSFISALKFVAFAFLDAFEIAIKRGRNGPYIPVCIQHFHH